MKKLQLFTMSAAVVVLSSLTSCDHLAQRAAPAVSAEQAAETSHTPRYLRDSEEWGRVVKQKQHLEEFESIQTSGLVDILFTQGEEFNVVVEGNEKVLPLYDFSVDDGALIVMTQKEQVHNSIPFVRLYVTAPTLTNIHLRGAGDVMMRQPVEFFNNLDIHISGAGDIEIDSLLCDAFTAEVNGAGDIKVRRLQCLSSDIRVNGTGETIIKRLSCQEDADLNIFGEGKAEVKVKCRNLTVNVFGAGEADIDCKCELVTAHASGTGRIDLEGEAGDVKTQRDGLASVSTRHLRLSK